MLREVPLRELKIEIILVKVLGKLFPQLQGVGEWVNLKLSLKPDCS